MIKEKRSNLLAITQELIHYIKNNNYKTNAFVWLFEKEALIAAAEADRKVLSGKPLVAYMVCLCALKKSFG